mgnify:CR=1 FL=1
MATKTVTKAQLEEENSLLKDELKDTQAKIEELTKQIQMLATMQSGAMSARTVETKPDRNITFVNMTTGTVILRGSQFWDIEGQFNSRTFSSREARVIVSNMNNFIREGYVFITDAEFVEENDLSDTYRTLLSDEGLKNLLSQRANEVVDIYQMVSDGQKEIIIKTIVEKKLNNQYVDANILAELGRLSGKNLMGIEPLEDEE